MLDFYNSLPTRMQDRRNLKGLLTRQLKDSFFSGLRKHNERLRWFLWGLQKDMPVNLGLLNVDLEKDSSKYINFQWKRGICLSVLHLLSFWKKQKLFNSQRTVNSYCIYHTMRKIKKLIISNFKKWIDAKSQNVDLFSHGYSQTLKVNELLKPMQANTFVSHVECCSA